MTQTIYVPGQGNVDFPDNMSDDQISSAIKSNMKGGVPASQQLLQDAQGNMPDAPVDIYGKPMVSSMFGQMPNPSNPQNVKRSMMPDMSKGNMQNAAGMMTMMMAPEVKWLPEALTSKFAQEGIPKLLKEYFSTVGKTGTSSAAGTAMMPGSTSKDIAQSGLIGGAFGAALTPFGMAMRSQNPMVRLAAGAGLGLAGGHAISNATDDQFGMIPDIASTALGAYLGTRGGGAAQMAAHNISDALTPGQINLAQGRQAAGNALNVPLTLAEKTGNPIIQEMQNQAAGTASGSKVLYPFSLNRQPQEEKAYKGFLNSVSLPNAQDKIHNLYESAKAANPNVDVKPVVDYLDSQIRSQPEGDIKKALLKAKTFLRPSQETMESQAALLQPYTDAENHVRASLENLKSQLPRIQNQAQSSYFNYASPVDKENVNWAQQSLDKHQSMLDQLSTAKNQIMQQNGIGDVSNKLRDLHIAQMNMHDLGQTVEGSGESSIGRTANREVQKVKDLLKQQIGKSSPDYATASDLASRNFTRGEIEKKMASSELSGSNFYDKILKNRDEYQDLYNKLGNKNNPNKMTKPQMRLAAMREAFPDLMKDKSGTTIGKEAPESNFSIKGLYHSMMNNLFLNKYHKAVADLLISPNWHTELMNLSHIGSGEDRGIAFGRLLSKVANAGTAAATSQGREDYGTQ